MIILREKYYSRWDDTDELKRMKDSDILAEEKKKPKTGIGQVFLQAGMGAAIGAGAGAGFGGFKGSIKANKFANKAIAATNNGNMNRANRLWNKSNKTGFMPGAANGAKWGALIGGLGAGMVAMNARKKEAQDAEFYNKRLAYAQKQAARREKKDWQGNMETRDGYSY